MAKITEIDRRSDEFHDIVNKIAKASWRAFIEAGCPIPDWFEDTNKSVAIDFVAEIIDRGLDVENNR